MPLSQIVSASIEDGAVAPVDLSSVAQYTGFKNRVINGGMQIAQRGTSFSYGAQNYTLDRWSGVGFASAVSQSTDVPAGFRNSIKVQRPAANTATSPFVISQCIESNNCYDLSSQSVTLSFWAKAGANFSAASSNLIAQIYTGTVADQGLASYATWTGVATPISISFPINTTWTRYSFTGTFGAGVLEAAVFFFYSPTGTAGADDSFFVTGVQIEKGITATSFDYRPYGTELALCQRYYENLGCYVSTSAWATIVNGAAPKVSKRTTPTLSVIGIGSGSGAAFTWANGAGDLGSGIAYQTTGNSAFAAATLLLSAEL
jgi:hypothetical protein